MPNLYDTIVFNRFPANKKLFCNLLYQASEFDREISVTVFLEPRSYDRIYFTMSDRELESVGRRRGDPDMAGSFPECDAVYSYKGQCIVLHIPAMAGKLAQVELRPEDPEGKILFTIHLFGCLFHELGHACHVARVAVESFDDFICGKKRAARFSTAESEKIAEESEEKLVKRFGEFLEQNDLSWADVAERLLRWEKVGPVLLQPRNQKG
jgi:hypothetical protein